MKKYICFIYLLFFSPILVFSQIVKVIALTYNENEFNIETIGGKTHITSNFHDLSLPSDPHVPALPYIGVNVLVGQDEQYSSFTYTSSELLFADNAIIPPCPVQYPTSLSPAYNSNIAQRYPNSIYPDTQVIYTGTNLMDGHKILSFVVCPFRYDVNNKQLYLKDSMNLSINLNSLNHGDHDMRNRGGIGTSMRKNVMELAINKDDIDELYRNPASTSSIDYKYLIVTSNSLKPAFQLLADWKTRKGVKAKVLTIEEINNTYTGSTQQLRIKEALADYYNGDYNGLKYVLLGGDVSVVPSIQCYIKYRNFKLNELLHQYDSTIYVNHTPTDLYYACLDDMNWDTNNNGEYGEVEDSIDIIPEIIVTRLPAATVSQAEAMVSRILSYEKSPNTQNWVDKILMSGAGDTLYYNNNGVVYSDAEYKGNRIFNNYIHPNWDGQRVRFYDTCWDFPQDSVLNAINLQSELRKGYNFFYMDTHGSPILWKLEKKITTYYYPSNCADTLHNTGRTIILTSACHTNGIDNPTCLSKAFMKNADSGILAYLGSSREGWGSPGLENLGNSNLINAEAMKKLFTSETHCFAEAVQYAKNKYALRNPKYNTVYRWLHFTLNPLCDPEMPVYLSKPEFLSGINMSLSNNTLSVSTGLSDCRITAMSLSDGGASLYEVYDSVSSAIINNFTNGCGICITKPGYIPYLADFSDIEYIQNETFDGQRVIWANEVQIGSNVTTNKPTGPVSIESGSTVIHSRNVTIKNDFEVKTGALFEVK